MNTELKPGMMALIIGSTGYKPETIGMVIEILEVTREVAFWSDGVEILHTLRKHLMPIKPEADPLHVKEEQHASA